LEIKKGLAKDHAKSLNREGKRVVDALVEGSVDTPARKRLYFTVELNCNIMLYQVTSNTGSATHRPSAPSARLLAFVLLAFVTYAATAEITHRHGGLSLSKPGSSATAINPAGDASSSANDSRALGECLICQLRQQLSFSLLNAPPLIVASQVQFARTRAAAVLSFSRPDTPQRGRAPPLASLI
jgi:hypothetical protein